MNKLNNAICNINALGYTCVGWVLIMLEFYGFAALAFLAAVPAYYQVYRYANPRPVPLPARQP